MRIAFVHDDLIQYGGAERLLVAMHEIWPEAPVYTSMATQDWIKRAEELGIELYTSWMQKFPFKKSLYREYFFFYPFVFESFNFNNYDVVISSSTRYSHGIITTPDTLHIAYMNSPGRMFWEPNSYFVGLDRLFHKPLKPFLSILRNWDYISAQRVDYFIANSKTPAARIQKYYKRDSKIIYPFVEIEKFGKVKSKPGDYFLIVSRLVSWKKIDVAISACNELGLKLKIVGGGPDYKRLQNMAGKTVEILGRLSDEEVVRLYAGCRAFILTQEEDFGITPLEALACGKPVIAYKGGGALETLNEGETGLFFYPQNKEVLVRTLRKFSQMRFDSKELKKYSLKYSKGRFQKELKNFVESKYNKGS